MRVNEVFCSLQGEGVFTGRAAVFVRLAGCNLRCPFCDTQHEDGREMSCEEVLEAVAAFPTRHVVFTGGEPALQLTAEILDAFKARGYFVQVETNGTRRLPPAGIDWVTCSPKADFCEAAEIRQPQINEVKVVFDGTHDPAKWLHVKAEAYCLQPCDTGDTAQNEAITAQCVDYILRHPEWRLSLQTHKILHVR